MQSNRIKDLLNLKDVLIKSVKNLEDVVEIYIQIPVCKQICPHCTSKTTTIDIQPSKNKKNRCKL